MDVIEHDELTRTEALVARAVLGPYRDWNPDIAMRYLPLVRIVREHGLDRAVTEVGSGSVGIGPYLRRPFTGVDTTLSPPTHKLLRPIEASVLETGLGSRSQPCVVSTDMLEHLPKNRRQAAVTELVRITSRLLVLAVPCGVDAETHDREMAQLFRRERGVDHRFLLEHVANGLPSRDELHAYLCGALSTEARMGTARFTSNSNLRLRSLVMRRWINRRPVDKVAWVGLTWLSRLLAHGHWEPAYRQIAIVEFTDAGC
jgi:hypothetical protein